MNWAMHIRHYSDYLKIERSLSPNSVEAYVHDITLLSQFMALDHATVSLPKLP